MAQIITTSVSNFPLVRTEIAPSVETFTGLSYGGNKVYSRRFTGTSNGPLLTITTLSSVDRLITVMGSIEKSTGGRVQLNHSESGTITDRALTFILDDGVTQVLKFGVSGLYDLQPFDFTIFYFKQGDTATAYDGSPISSTGLSVPLLPISLSPSVKTDTGLKYAGDILYSKRYTGTTNATDGFMDLETLSGLTRLVHVEGVAENSSFGNYTFPMCVAAGTGDDRFFVQVSSANVLQINHAVGFNSQPYDFTFYWTE